MSRAATVAGDEYALSEIGEEMFAWLDTGGVAAAWAKASIQALEVTVDVAAQDEPLAALLLDAPWELLAHEGRFLAAQQDNLFTVARRVAADNEEAQKASAPTHSDIALMFMAAAPVGQSDLDHDAEETAILEATRARGGDRPLAHVVVEESGNVDLLGERLAQDGPFEALHVSCHGNLDEEKGPYLALETELGEPEEVTPGKFLETLGAAVPRLVFVSACRTAERGGVAQSIAGGEGFKEGQGGPASTAGASPEFAHPYVRRLAGRVANVLGWDGSVMDADATLFAEAFYRQLARQHQPVPQAAALARRALFNARNEDNRLGRHWHLARVYLGRGGVALCRAGLPARKAAHAGERAFLNKEDKQVPVATPAQFVGRRRQIQEVLRAFRQGKTGVLLYGMGNLGKSSLAARVADRMTGRLRTAVVFERYDALSVFDQIVKALPAETQLDQQPQLEAWRANVEASEQALTGVLKVMLEGVLDTEPVLLVVDDLERALEEPSPDKDTVEPKSVYRRSLGAVLQAFTETQTASKLLLTSRFRFALMDEEGEDVAAGLHAIQLRPMEDREREKQWRAAARAASDAAEASDAAAELLDRALHVAAGNPGLQEILTRPLLAGETKPAEAAVEAVERFRKTGEHPAEENKAHEFFERVTFETYERALTDTQRTALSAVTLFEEEVPIPLPALEAVAEAAGVAEQGVALTRLFALGLLDYWGEIGGHPHASANPLARPLVKPPVEDNARGLAAASLPALAAAWRDDDGDFPPDPRCVEMARLCLVGRAMPDLLNAAAGTAVGYLYRLRDDARGALDLAVPALAAIEEAGLSPDPWLVMHGMDCAWRLADVDILETFRTAAQHLRGARTVEAASLLASLAVQNRQRGDLDAARADAEAAAAIFAELGREREVAVSRGQIADVLQARGELDEALRIRREEELPVYERLGDQRARAVALQKTASALLELHGLDEEHGQEIVDALAEAFAIARRLGIPDGIAGVGSMLGQVLAAVGHPEAVGVLQLAADAAEKLGRNERAAEVRAMIAKIEDSP